jgi:ketosteroid isomerase-like protein
MTKLFRFPLAAALGLALAAGAAAAAAAPPPEDGKDPAALERALVAAIAAGDLATYDRIVADDYVVFDATGKTITKAEVVASYKSGTRKYTDLTIYDVESRIFGDTAVVAAKTRGMRREDGKDVPNRVRYVRVFARRGGAWRAVSQMAAPMPKEPDAPGSSR